MDPNEDTQVEAHRADQAIDDLLAAFDDLLLFFADDSPMSKKVGQHRTAFEARIPEIKAELNV